MIIKDMRTSTFRELETSDTFILYGDDRNYYAVISPVDDSGMEVINNALDLNNMQLTTIDDDTPVRKVESILLIGGME